MQNNTLPPVSVIIPVYNHEKYIIHALDSVFNQTYPSIELIIIDDGSKDKCPALIEAYLEKYKAPSHLKREWVFLKEKNKGAHATINHGLSLAKHDFLAILNSDDYFALDRLEVMVKEMIETGAEIAFSEVAGVDENDQLLPPSHFFSRDYNLNLRYFISLPTVSFGFLNSNIAVSTGNFLFTKSLLKDVGPFKNYLHAHDYDFMLRAIASYEPLFIRKPLYFYRMHSNNTITQNRGLTRAELSQMVPDFLMKMIDAQPKNKLAPSPWNFPTEFATVRQDAMVDKYLSTHLKDSPYQKTATAEPIKLTSRSKNSGPKIALFTHALSYTGAPKVVYDLSRLLQEQGYRPKIFSLEHGPLKKSFEELGIPVTVVPKCMQVKKAGLLLTKFTSLSLFFFYLLFKLPKRVIFNSFVTMYAGLPASYIPFLKRYWFIHESLPPGSVFHDPYFKPAMKTLRDKSKFTFLFGSKSTQEIWQRSQVNGEVVYWSGLPSTPMKEIKPRPIKNILAMGTVEMRKGVHTLVDAFIECIKRKTIADDVTLTVVGFPEELNSPYQGDVVMKVIKENLQDRIHLVKIVPMDQVDPFYEAADLFVMTSSNECMPLVLLTAMSKGLPIVTTAANGCEEAIENGISGYTCPPLNHYVLADTLEKAINNSSKSWEMAQNAQHRFNEQFSLEQNKKNFMKVFEGVSG